MFLPSEDEWYKAAYYKGGSANAGYWHYATQSNAQPINTLPDTGNHANYRDTSIPPIGNGTFTDPINYFTPVGAFALSPGPYGTFDQSGELYNFTDTVFNAFGRASRGGSYNNFAANLESNERVNANPALAFLDTGFRVAGVASVPEPSSVVLFVAGIVALTVARCRPRRR